MGVRENRVEKYLDEQVKFIGGITRKWVSPGHDGVPDRIVILDGKIIFVEVKTVSGRLSTIQQREHFRLAENGAVIHTVYGTDGVDVLIKELIK